MDTRYQTALTDKRILVTGNTTGIGLATVPLLVSESARVPDACAISLRKGLKVSPGERPAHRSWRTT
ncbi:hypothetical protein U1872_21860 [Sphingomonas sp. RB3P16]|uniref:hypothetical protein n=1 Tax=Parasphingomonas frigoris TaxID=3096163 RepID=UPI002FC928E6